MDQNPYQSPGDHDEQTPPEEGSQLLRRVFWHTCTVMACGVLLLFCVEKEAWIYRLLCGLAVALAVWSFYELVRLGYMPTANENVDDEA